MLTERYSLEEYPGRMPSVSPTDSFKVEAVDSGMTISVSDSGSFPRVNRGFSKGSDGRIET